jgi:hypothetical protein
MSYRHAAARGAGSPPPRWAAAPQAWSTSRDDACQLTGWKGGGVTCGTGHALRDLGGHRQRLEVHVVVVGPGAGAAAREAQVARHVALLAALGWLVGWFVPLADTLRSGTEVTLTVKVIEHLLER